jgi:RHS repeat-associated protein
VARAGLRGPCGAGTRYRSFTYDSLKRLLQATNPENGTLTYTYDQSGNLLTRADAVRTVTFSLNTGYDGMNRATSKSYSDSTPQVNYSCGDVIYPPQATCQQQGGGVCGRLISVASSVTATAPPVVNSYSNFDPVGRVKTSSQQIAGGTQYTFQYGYDLSGALASEQYPSNRTVCNTYDPAGRLASVAGVVTTQANPCSSPSGQTSYATIVQYAPQGAIQSLTLGSGVNENWGFNTLLQPNSLTAKLGSTVLMTLGWQYNTGADNGNVMGQTIARTIPVANNSPITYSFSQNFGYADPSNRLLTASENGGWTQNYNYDAFGNRTLSAGSYLPNAAYTPQGAVAGQFPNNQWIRGTPVPCGPAGNSGDQYDCAGNQTALAMAVSPYNQTASTFTYDGENRLLAASVGGQGGASFVYDGEGRRVQKITPSATTTYIHDAKGELAMELSTAAPTASGTEYLTADTLGSTRLITDASGNPQRCIDYLPFGEEIPAGVDGRTGPCYETLGSGGLSPTGPEYPAAADVAAQKFTGKERDAETGLDYFGARYFSSAQGRFTTPDWSTSPEPIPYGKVIDPQTLNLYAYVRNNPLGRADADGHADDDWLHTHAPKVAKALDAVEQSMNGGARPGPPPAPKPPPGQPIALLKTDIGGRTTTLMSSTPSKPYSETTIETHVVATRNSRPGAADPYSTPAVIGIDNPHAGEAAYGVRHRKSITFTTCVSCEDGSCSSIHREICWPSD